MTTIADTIATVCFEFKVQRLHILSPRRARYIAWPRQAAMFLAHELTAKSYPQIGMVFDRDHTTVLSAIYRVKLRVDPHSHKYDADFAATLTKCRARLEAMPSNDMVMVGAEYRMAI